MGWKENHLHEFEKDGKRWGVVQLYEDEELDVAEDSDVTLAEVLKSEGDTMIYVYDFDDNWRHEVILEKIQPAEIALRPPVCLAGERRCPPEDVGGVSGYEEFLDVILDPTHEDYEHFVGWSGGHFVDECDLNAINGTLTRMRWPIRHRR